MTNEPKIGDRAQFPTVEYRPCPVFSPKGYGCCLPPRHAGPHIAYGQWRAIAPRLGGPAKIVDVWTRGR